MNGVAIRAEALAGVLARGDVWRGDALAVPAGASVPTGHALLDAELPGGGWPRGALTEFLVERAGVGEVGLLLPALARLSADSGWIALVAPPALPSAAAWAAAAVAPERLVVIHAGREAAWCAEQLLRCGGFAGVLVWPGTVDAGTLRRLQVAAEGRPALACLWRPAGAAAAPSAAPLRVRLRGMAGRRELAVEILKRRGRPAARPLLLGLPVPGGRTGREQDAVAGAVVSPAVARSAGCAALA